MIAYGKLILMFVSFLFIDGVYAINPCINDIQPADSVWLIVPGKSELACRGQALNMYCCVTDGHQIVWSKWNKDTESFEDVNDDRTVVSDRGQRLFINTVGLSDDGDVYRCSVPNTDRSASKTISIQECDSCLEGDITFPDTALTNVSVLPTYNARLFCQILVGSCEEPVQEVIDANLGWYRFDSEGQMSALDELTGITVESSVSDGFIHSTVLISSVALDDYDSKYQCLSLLNFRTFRLQNRAPTGSVARSPGLPIILPSALAPGVILLCSLMVAIFFYDLRLLWRKLVYCGRRHTRPIFIVSSGSRNAVKFIDGILEPRIREYGFTIRTFYRDSIVGDLMEYEIEQLRECNLVIFVLSNDFLEMNSWAHDLALNTEIKRIFICLEDLCWREHHITLREQVEMSNKFFSRSWRFDWKAEFAAESCEIRAANRFFRFLKAQKMKREKALFWKRFRLALPVNESFLQRSVELARSLNTVGNPSYVRQESDLSSGYHV